MSFVSEHCLVQITHHRGAIFALDLQHGAEFFVEQQMQQMQTIVETLRSVAEHMLVEKTIHPQCHADVAGEHHFANRREQAAIGTVVIGE